jgi:hypothetical protein
MNEVVLAIIGGSCGAAIVTGTVSMIQFLVNRKDKKSCKQEARDKALRYLMLYIIEERATAHIREGRITLEQRRRLHHWHKVYHDGLGGNGDADALMAEVDELPTDLN